MRRLGIIAALGTMVGMAGAVATGTPALAGRGPKWQIASPQPFTTFCGLFDVQVSFPVVKDYSKVLKASDGSVITLGSGALQASYTNLSTGKTITENISGPGTTTVNPDGSVVVSNTGHNGLFLTPAQAQQFGLPITSVTAGPITASFDAAGNLTRVSLGGHVLVDVCAALS